MNVYGNESWKYILECAEYVGVEINESIPIRPALIAEIMRKLRQQGIGRKGEDMEFNNNYLCEQANKDAVGCLGYSCEGGDEPCEVCKKCKEYTWNKWEADVED